MARPKKPTAIKRAAGTLRVDRTTGDEPTPLGRLGPAPAKLPAEAQRRWDELARSAWWLTDADRQITELYCREWALYIKAVADVAHYGQVWERESDGYTQLNGARQVHDRCVKSLMDLGAKMGLDPASRAGIATPREKKTGIDRYAIN